MGAHLRIAVEAEKVGAAERHPVCRDEVGERGLLHRELALPAPSPQDPL